MQLTFSVEGAVYTIYNEGKPWIVQDTDKYNPYPAESVAQAAQAHIDAIIADYNQQPEPSADERIAELQQHVSDLQDALIELAGMITAGGGA